MTAHTRKKTSPNDTHALLRNEERAASAWAAQADGLVGRELVGAALLAEARAVGAGAAPDRLRTWVGEEHTKATGVTTSSPRVTNEAVAAISKMRRFGHADMDKMVARLADALREGADVGIVLGTIAETLHEAGSSLAALDFLRAGILVADDRGPLASMLALILLDTGRFEAARTAIDHVTDAALSASLKTRVEALAHPFDFRAASYLDGEPDVDAEISPLSLAEAQAGIRSIGRRVGIVRAAIVARIGEAPWLPDVALLVDGFGHLLADDYDAGDLSNKVPALVFELRKEWARLCWAIAALGGTAPVMPTEIARPRCAMDFVDAFTTARYNLLCDVAEGKEPSPQDELDKQTLTSTFAGTPLVALDQELATIWLDETEAALSGLRWAMGRVKTPWEPSSPELDAQST